MKVEKIKESVILIGGIFSFSILLLSMSAQRNVAHQAEKSTDKVITKIAKSVKKIDQSKKWSEVYTFNIPARHYTDDSFEGEAYFTKKGLQRIISKCLCTNNLFFRTFYLDGDQLIYVRERSYVYKSLSIPSDKLTIEITEAYASGLPEITNRYFNDYYFQTDSLYRHLDNDNGEIGEKMVVVADTNYSRRMADDLQAKFEDLVKTINGRPTK